MSKDELIKEFKDTFPLGVHTTDFGEVDEMVRIAEQYATGRVIEELEKLGERGGFPVGPVTQQYLGARIKVLKGEK